MQSSPFMSSAIAREVVPDGVVPTRSVILVREENLDGRS